MRIAFLGIVLLCIFNVAALAAPRKWKDISGKHTTEADFVELDGASLRLKRTDGKEVLIPLARLAVDDQIFAMREARLRAVTPPELSAKGKELSRQLVKEVKAAADPYSLKTKFDFDDLEGDLAPASRALQKSAEELITLEGRRSAVAPAISELLKDGSAAVRIVAAKGAQEFGDAAVSAAPSLVVCLDDPLELVQSLAKQAIDHFGDSTDAAVPALLSAMEKGSLSSRKDVARLLIGAGNRGSGPHLEDAVPRLARLVTDPKQEGQRRVLAAYALHGVLEVFRHDRGFDHRLHHAARNQDIQEWVEQQTASRSKLLRKNAAGLAAALPAMEDAELISLTFVIVAKDAPEDLRKLPSPVLSALVEKLQDVDFDNDLLHNIDSPLDILQSLIQRRNLNLQLSTEQSLKLLASENDRLRRFGQSQLIRSPEQTRKIMPQIAKLLRESKNSEVRTSALVILQRGAMVSPDDLSSLPVIPVRLKTTSTGATFQIGEAKASGIPQLAAAVTEFKPPKPAEEAFDIEQALKEATADDEQQVRYMALQALASRGTESAKKIVQDLSRTALKEETRELAQNVLEQRRDGGFEVEEGEKKDDSPFEPGKKKERRSLVAELVLDADLRMEPALQILTAVMDADVQGLRVVLLSKEGKRQTAIELVPPNVPRNRQHAEQPYLQLKLAERGADGRISLQIKSPRQEDRWRAVPGVETLQFLLDWQLAQEGRRSSEFREEFREEMLFVGGFPGIHMGRGGVMPVGAGALPHVVSLTAAPGATMGDCLQVLEGIGVSEEAGQRDDLIQWIRLQVGEKSTATWYMKVVQQEAGPPPVP